MASEYTVTAGTEPMDEKRRRVVFYACRGERRVRKFCDAEAAMRYCNERNLGTDTDDKGKQG
jgi:hypothetical protein